MADGGRRKEILPQKQEIMPRSKEMAAGKRQILSNALCGPH